MAANSKSTREIATLGKRLAKHIFKRDPAATARRFGNTSVYDKNVDDQVQPSVVPDDMIEPLSEKYWGPNPQTGVFGPASGSEAAGTEHGSNSSPANGPNESVLEEKAWFRPTSLEDLEKPHHS